MAFSFKPSILLVCGALALAGCTDPNSLGGGSAAIVPGSADDPASPAYFQTTIGDRVLFAVDQSTLSPEAQLVLDGQAGWLLTNVSYTALIEGHADEQGTREYNLALSARRADQVRSYLIERGIAGNRLQVVPYGKERPALLCSEESCYTQNRRAVTVLAAGVTS